jgi:hypothetical protein
LEPSLAPAEMRVVCRPLRLALAFAVPSHQHQILLLADPAKAVANPAVGPRRTALFIATILTKTTLPC